MVFRYCFYFYLILSMNVVLILPVYKEVSVIKK